MKQNILCEKRQVREISVDIEADFSENMESSPDLGEFSANDQKNENQITDAKIGNYEKSIFSPKSATWAKIENAEQSPKQKNVYSEKSDKVQNNAPEITNQNFTTENQKSQVKRNYQEWSYKKLEKCQYSNFPLGQKVKTKGYVLGGKQAPMKHFYSNRQARLHKVGAQQDYNQRFYKNNQVQQSSTNSDAEFIGGGELSISAQNSNTMQFQQRNSKIKDISTHFASGPSFQGQAKNLAQFQATANYAIITDEKAVATARFIQKQQKPISKFEKSDQQPFQTQPLPHGSEIDRTKLEKLRQIEHQKFNKEHDRRKIIAYRKRYLNLFSETSNPRKRMHHLIKDFNQKPRSKISKCELPKKKNNFAKAILTLNNNINQTNPRKVIKAKKALRRYQRRYAAATRPQLEAPEDQTEIGPNDITSASNQVNVVISHIEKFIQRKRISNEAVTIPLKADLVPEEQRFSFLDVTSLWQDPDTTQKLMTIRKVEYQETKAKAKAAMLTKMACSLSNSIDSNFGTGSDDDYKESDLDFSREVIPQKQQILGENFLFNQTMLDKNELHNFYKNRKNPEVQNNNIHGVIDYCSQADVKAKIVSQSTAIDSNFKTADSKTKNTEIVDFKIQDLNSKIASDELSMEDQDEELTQIRPSSRPSSIQIRMSSLNQEFEEN